MSASSPWVCGGRPASGTTLTRCARRSHGTPSTPTAGSSHPSPLTSFACSKAPRATAWGKAIEAAQRAGAYSDVCFDDPAIHATIEDCGGWPKFCRTETAELSYLQHRFTEAHRTYSAQETFEFPRCLVGDRSPDDVFAKRGLKPPKPILIGDTAKAQQVYLLGANRSQRSSVIALHALDAAAAEVTPLIDNPFKARA